MKTFLALSEVSAREWKSHQLRELRMTNGCQACGFPLPGDGESGRAGSWAAQCLHGQGLAGERRELQGQPCPGTGHRALGLCRYKAARIWGLFMQGKFHKCVNRKHQGVTSAPGTQCWEMGWRVTAGCSECVIRAGSGRRQHQSWDLRTGRGQARAVQGTVRAEGGGKLSVY